MTFGDGAVNVASAIFCDSDKGHTVMHEDTFFINTLFSIGASLT